MASIPTGRTSAVHPSDESARQTASRRRCPNTSQSADERLDSVPEVGRVYPASSAGHAVDGGDCLTLRRTSVGPTSSLKYHTNAPTAATAVLARRSVVAAKPNSENCVPVAASASTPKSANSGEGDEIHYVHGRHRRQSRLVKNVALA